MTEGNEVAGSQVSVGLRVTLDPEDGSEQVHLVAVVQDLRGNVSETALGDYDDVSEQPTTGAELVNVTIIRGDAAERILLQHSGDFVDVLRVASSGESEVIQRIPLEEGSAVVAREPRFETE